MKRLMTLALVVLLTAMVVLPIVAQTGKIRFSAMAGLNFAKLRGKDAGSGLKTRTGLHGGGLVSAELGPSLAVQSGLYYSQEGTSVDVGGGITGTVKIDYLEVPLYLRGHTTLQGTTPLRPYLYAGPALGFKVGCTIEASNGTNSASVNCDDPTANFDVKGTQFGLHFGAGVEIGRFSLGGRYQLGLRSIDNTGGNADVKNSVFALSAGYRF